ncbi:DUF3226 domain-containing protein [Arcicella sp. DC2W]|uniref:DUF3226 domain-containing protein n=1 Tax=Arcicella gelida TaxID=2984195 RepID=A0ABU5S3V7_9BACT|nr:DUF3226 domain-containing protein [Arcicella sp. DC2W]MEA5403131.1 DUF3226 domain-containing protein [Arcicella sp. DC2W]
MKNKEKYNQKLLVEGKDDTHVIWALCENFDVYQNFDVVDCEGISNLFNIIPVRLKQSELKSLAIIIDADLNIEERWKELRNIFENSHYTLPSVLPASGLIHEENDRKIGVWLMPNNDIKGMLEDFVKFLIPENNNLKEITERTLNELEKNQYNLYNKDLHRTKAFIHTWLAWQETPGTPMGLAITKKYLSTEDSEICIRFIEWLKMTFKDD